MVGGTFSVSLGVLAMCAAFLKRPNIQREPSDDEENPNNQKRPIPGLDHSVPIPSSSDSDSDSDSDQIYDIFSFATITTFVFLIIGLVMFLLATR